MTFSTSISDIFVPSRDCSSSNNCVATYTYYPSDKSKLLNADVLTNFVHYTESTFMTYNWNYSVTGDLREDEFKLQEIDTKNPVNLVFMDIKKSTPVYIKYDYDGIIGLGVVNQGGCFMDQIKAKKVIKDESFAIYINSDSD